MNRLAPKSALLLVIGLLVPSEPGSTCRAQFRSPTVRPAEGGSDRACPAEPLVAWPAPFPGLAGTREGSQLLHRLPLAFVENRGQWDHGARFRTSRGGVSAWVEKRALTIQLEKIVDDDRVEGTAIRLRFDGASEAASVAGDETLGGTYNFFHGSDPAGWVTKVPAYRLVT